MMSHKVLIYVALVVLIVQVAVTSAAGGKDCKCTEFDGNGNCVQRSCPCGPAGKKCTPPKARNQAVKANSGSKTTTGSKTTSGSKTGTSSRAPLASKNTNTQPRGNGRATRQI